MKQCLFCDEPLYAATSFQELFRFRSSRRHPFCQKCLNQFIPIISVVSVETVKGNEEKSLQPVQCFCLRCQKELKQDTDANNICQDCLYWEKLSGIIVEQQAIYQYNDFATNFLWRIKHNGDLVLIDGLKHIIKSFLLRHYDLARTCFVFIPTDDNSLQQRGFHLMQYLFSTLDTDIHCLNVFPHIAETRIKQHLQSYDKRKAYAQSAFIIDDDMFADMLNMEYCHIVVVDDVYTTGATLLKALKSLKMKTDTKISSFTVFR